LLCNFVARRFGRRNFCPTEIELLASVYAPPPRKEKKMSLSSLSRSPLWFDVDSLHCRGSIKYYMCICQLEGTTLDSPFVTLARVGLDLDTSGINGFAMTGSIILGKLSMTGLLHKTLALPSSVHDHLLESLLPK